IYVQLYIKKYSNMPLTDKQQQFYKQLIAFFRKHLRMPTHREAARLSHLKSANSSVQYHRALEKAGVLKKDDRGNYLFAAPAMVWPGQDKTGATIPVLGEITAGAMQEAVQVDLGELTF